MELGGIFDHHNPVARIDERRERVQHGRFAGRRAAADQNILDEGAEATLVDLDFLQERGLVEYISKGDLLKALSFAQRDEQQQRHEKFFSAVRMERIKSKYPLLSSEKRALSFRVRTGDPKYVTPESERQLFDFYTRVIAVGLTARSNIETVPVCWHELPVSLPEGQGVGNTFNEVLNISFKYFPIPDDTCARQDILDFKEDTKNKQWAFRHFLAELATEKKTEAGVREEIEYLLTSTNTRWKFTK